MFCSECGEKVQGNDEFCKKCQGVGQVDDKLKPKHKKAAMLGVLIPGLILLTLMVFLGGRYLQTSQNEKAQQALALKEMQQVLDASNMDLDQLIVSDTDKASYLGLLEELKSAIKNKDTSNSSTYAEDIEAYQIAFIKDSQLLISDRLGILESMDTSPAFGFEINTMDQYAKDIGALVLEGKYVSAMGIGDQWEDLAKSMIPTQDYQMLVSQVDTRDYPKVKLFMQIKNLITGETVNLSDFDKFSITEEVNGDYLTKNILNAAQLNQAEKLNINLTADISGSMGDELGHVKQVMKDFLGYMQFGAGDRASLITFDDNISVDVDFTSEKNTLVSAVDHMTLGNMTALYDALYVSVSKTAMEEGAKCVIAFTDGEDNSSEKTPEDVIELAKQYKIPVFIIGIGQSLDTSTLENIANMTGGYYKNVTRGGSIQEIYNRIYREQKELYMLEYETDQKVDDATMRNAYITYLDEAISMRNTSSFTPSLLNEKPKGVEELIGRSSIHNNQIEDEILRIRAIWNGDRAAMDREAYQKTLLASGAVAYSDPTSYGGMGRVMGQ